MNANWEVSAALRVLYIKNLQGDVLFPDVDVYGEAQLSENGVVDFGSKSITPYDRAVFVSFDGNPRHLRVLENLQSELSIAWPTPTYAPHRCILNDQPLSVRWRTLVGEPGNIW